MKKIQTTIIALILALTVAMPVLAFPYTLEIIDQRTEGGVVFVPLRQIAYAYGAAVEWDGANRAVHITRANGGSVTVLVDTAGGFIENGRTWIPYEYAAELGNWLTGIIPSPICFEKASYLLERLDVVLDADNGYLWGVNLRGPVVIADAITRYAVANMPDPDGEIFTKQGGLYAGRLPEGTLIGNTASYFGEMLWGMVTWGMIESNPDGLEGIVSVLLHELFHAQQPDIFEGQTPFNGRDVHMRELDPRISINLEINALLMALHTTGNERMTAVQDALSIRAERRSLHIDAEYDENTFELMEGTAVYTEAALGRDTLKDRIALVEKNMNMNSDHIVSQYGYHTGALYGLLLDEFAIDWRGDISWEHDLAAMLREGIRFTKTIPMKEIDLERYGYSEIRAFEETWVTETARLTQEARDALSGPLLLIDAMGEFGQTQSENLRFLYLQGLGVHNDDEFDYGDEDVFLLVGGQNDERTVFYGDFSYAAEFGEVEFTGGFLMLWRAMWRHGIPADNIEIDGSRIICPNWVLTLNDGFELREVGGGHFGIGMRQL